MPELAALGELLNGRARRDASADASAPLVLTRAMVTAAGIVVPNEPPRTTQPGASPALAGDVLITAAGDPAAALVPRELAGAEVGEQLLVLRGADAATAASVVRFFATETGKAALGGTRSGATIARSTLEAAARIEVELLAPAAASPAPDGDA